MKLTVFTLLTVLALGVGSAESAPVTAVCPDPVQLGREFVVITDPVGATCLMSGTGDLIAGDALDVMVLAGWDVIDKDSDPDAIYPNDNWFAVTGIDSQFGFFFVSPLAWAAYDQIAIGFDVGPNNILPTWAVFELPSPETVGFEANFTVPSGGGALLQHAILYGMSDQTTAIPEPASLLLFGSGLALLTRRMRRRRQ